MNEATHRTGEDVSRGRVAWVKLSHMLCRQGQRPAACKRASLLLGVSMQGL